MDVKTSTPLLQALAGVQAGAPTAGGIAQKAGGVRFADALDSALQSVSQTQFKTAELQRQFQLDVDGVSLEQTMVAMQESQIAFQGALTVRNRLVSAYTDIMNMTV